MSEAERFLSRFNEVEPSPYDKGVGKALGVQIPDDWDLTNKHGIADANSSGQGSDSRHGDNPFMDVIDKHGYKYSHTTPVYHGDNAINYHTFKHSALGPDYNVCASKHPGGWRWEVSHRAGLTSKQGTDPQGLDSFLSSYLKRHSKKNSRSLPESLSKRLLKLVEGTHTFFVDAEDERTQWVVTLCGRGITAERKDPDYWEKPFHIIGDAPQWMHDANHEIQRRGKTHGPKGQESFEEGVCVSKPTMGYNTGEIWWKRGAPSIPSDVKKIIAIRVRDILANEDEKGNYGTREMS